MNRREDIQIMRGLAVLLVVLFHLDFSGLKNGFLGVDVFFVISGYLMAVLYRGGPALDFYRRRAVRLLPAYFFTVVATLAVSVVVTLPADHVQVVKQAQFASVFASNIGYWLQNSYFSKADFNPLLHLWSLGVEIQFYALVPLLVWLHGRVRHALLVIFSVSLMTAMAVVLVSPKTSFFMMPLRIWQFLVGAAIARYFSRDGAVIFPRPWFGAGALLAIVLVVGVYPVNVVALDPVMGHPGGAALLITLTTAAVLCWGLPQRIESSWCGRASSRLGDWSYSIYLAHFPIIVLALYSPFSGTRLSPPSVEASLAIMAAIVFFSAAIHVLFERRGRWKSSMAWVLACSSLTICLALSSVHLSRIGYTSQELSIMAASSDRNVYRCGKLFRILHPTDRLCELTTGEERQLPILLLVGDSHADSLKTSFTRVAQDKGYRVFFTVSNSPLLGGLDAMDLVDEMARLGAHAVVLHYASGNAEQAYDTGFVEVARQRGHDVSWLLPVPAYEQSVPALLWGRRDEGALVAAKPVNEAQIVSLLARLETDGVSTHLPSSVLCPDHCLLVTRDMRPLYFDTGHLTLTGAQMMEGIIHELIDDVGGPGLLAD